MSKLEQLEPKKVFHFFEEIAAIPHGSRNTKAISDYLVNFAKERNLEVYQDESNNVVIIQKASNGYENAEPIIIQGHMDMVCEKESDSNIDFEKDGLSLYVDGDFLKAEKTTLGGDDGIAVAYALAILDDPSIKHPRLEVVLTVDEEIGLLGAYDIDLSMLKGHKMLNIDSDVEGHFLTSCAGGLVVTGEIPVTRMSQQGTLIEIIVTGLFGGHSGAEIHKERGNADILMGRVLKTLFDETPYGILTLEGGLKDNAIPRECKAEILVPTENVGLVKEICAKMDAVFKKEFLAMDADVTVQLTEKGEKEGEVLDFASMSKVIYYLRCVPNGVQHMSMQIPGLVETSLNLGIMKLEQDVFMTDTSIRSSVSSRKEDLKDKLVHFIEMLGGDVAVDGDYPAWEYNPNSSLREEISAVYEKLFGKAPIFEAIHAGLECGILSEKIDNLDCVSFGPDNFDIHTPKERLSISSTKRVWDFLVAYLESAK